MTTESAQRVDLNVLPIKDLVRQARHEIEVVGNEINEAKSPISRIIRNMGIISRISGSDAVQAYLISTKTKVNILGYGWSKRKTGIIVSEKGIIIRWAESYKTFDGKYWEEMALETGDDKITEYCRSGSPEIRNAFERLAKLEPDQIVKKFNKAISKPIKVK